MPFKFTETQTNILKHSYIPGLLFIVAYFLGVYILKVDTNYPQVWMDFDFNIDTNEVTKSYNYFTVFAFVFMWMWVGIRSNDLKLALQLGIAMLVCLGFSCLESIFGSSLSDYIPISILRLLFFFIHPFALFGVAYAFFKGEKQLIFPHFLAGIFLGLIINQISEVWMLLMINHAEVFERMEEYRIMNILGLLRYASVLITPILLYAGHFMVDNLYKKHASLRGMSKELLSVALPISSQTFSQAFPILFWAVFSYFAAYLYSPEIFALQYVKGIFDKSFALFTYVLQVLTFFALLKILSNLVIGRIQTLKLSVKWNHFLSLLPLINLFPYARLVNKQVQEEEVFDVKAASKQTEKYTLSFCIAICVLLVFLQIFMMMNSVFSFPLVITCFLICLAFFALRLNKNVFKVIVGMHCLYLISSILWLAFFDERTYHYGNDHFLDIALGPDFLLVSLGLLYYIYLGFFPAYVEGEEVGVPFLNRGTALKRFN